MDSIFARPFPFPLLKNKTMLYFKLASILMLDITTNSAPQNICNLFTFTQDIHQYNTRSQCRSKGNISGGARERWRHEPLGGCGGMLPQKILKEAWKCYFQRSPRAICDLRISRIISLLRTLSQQTNAHWEYNTCNVNYKIENRLSLYLETSKCFTFQSHHSKFVVIKLSELPWRQT